MSLPSFITAVGQPAFTTEARVSDYVITQALGANEPTALFIKARYWQTRADYARPAANTTLTYDNGSENVDHQQVNRALGTRSYFCDPYCSWQRGSVENAIGLVRRYLPKKTDFAHVSMAQLKTIETRINNRPRKCLDFRTPAEVFKLTCCT